MRRQYLRFSLLCGCDNDGPYCGVESIPGLPKGFDVLNAKYDDIILTRNMTTLRYTNDLLNKINPLFNVGTRETFIKEDFIGGLGILEDRLKRECP